jgi:uncharacterized protein
MTVFVAVALGLGPLIARLATSRRRWAVAIDAFLLAAVTSWLVVATLPKAVALGGWWAVGSLIASAIAGRHLRHRDGRRPHSALRAMGLVGLAVEWAADNHVTQHSPSISASPTIKSALAVVMSLAVPAILTVLVDQGRTIRRQRADRWIALAAALAGAMGAASFPVIHPWPIVVPEALGALTTLRTLIVEASPGLLLALVMSALLHAFPMGIPHAWLRKGGPLGQALRGMVIGLPLPICSCGVVPLYRRLILAGTPPAAALAFLVATPELGIDAVFLSVPLLGPRLAVVRLIAAATAAVAVGLLLGMWINRSETFMPVTVTFPPFAGHARRPWLTRLRTDGLNGFYEAMDHTLPWVVVGLLVAALVEPLVDPAQLARLPTGLDVPIATFIGIPAYVCASAATPLVAVLMHKGLSAGAAIAFLLAGPATNITTFAVLARLHGKHVAFGFAIAISASATLLGWGINAMGVRGGIALHDVAEHSPGIVHWICAATLAVNAAAAVFRLGVRGILEDLLGGSQYNDQHDCDSNHDQSRPHHHSEGRCDCRHDRSSEKCTCANQQLGRAREVS